MTRTEIKDFLVDAGGAEGVAVTLPTSLYQVIGDSPCDTARLYTTINADERMLDGEYLYLKIKDLRHSATVSLNGRAIGMPTAEEPVYSYDIKDRLTLGENMLEITFEGGSELSSAGVFGGVEIVKFANQMIDSLSVETSREGDGAVVLINLKTQGSADAVRAVATLVSGSGQIYYAGLTKGRGKITVKDPLFWWPRGIGIQNLYKLTVNLYGESEIEDTAEIRIGFASLTTDGGVTEVNGEPFTPIGAVLGASRAKTPTEERAEILAHVAALAAAGVNTLIIPEREGRVSDELYNLADLYGIAVIHEISSATSLIRSRLVYQGYRPSVGMIDLVGGGDDIESITDTLRAICPKTDVNCRENKNEYTALYTLPTERTLSELVPEGERNPFSATLDVIKDEMLEMISRASEEYPYAPDLSALAYVTGLAGARETEARLLAERIASRRAIYDTREDTTGLLSTGILDSSYRRCSLYYYLSRGFAPTMLYATGEGAVLDFYVIRSERQELSATVDLRIVDGGGEPVFAQSIEVSVPKTSSVKIFSRDFTDKIAGRERELYLEYSLKDETGILSKRTYLFCETRKYKFTKPNVKAELAGAEKRFSLTLFSDSFASGVEVSFGTDGVFLSDNYFDLTAGTKHKIVVNTARSTTADELLDMIKIRTVNELIVK